jgi:hypothetical protein
MIQLTQKDIDKWNPRLKSINLGIIIDNYGTLQFFSQSQYSGWQGVSEKTIVDTIPKIKYHFTFSVSKKSVKRFDKILSLLLENGLSFSFSKKNSMLRENDIISKKITDFSHFLEESEVKIHNVTFCQRHYKLNLPISEVILFVNSVEESVKIISEFYEYEEDGTEICKLKYPVTSIVSIQDDKSGNYIILSHSFQLNDEKINPIYNIAKIETEINSEVLIFGQTFSVFESQITPNREDRLNILLS